MIGHDPDPVFAPVRSQTAFEETLERLGTAIKLGLLEPGARLPPERDLCAQLGISRSTLRQALTALVQSGHLRAVRGRRGGTFVAERPPPAPAPSLRAADELARGLRHAGSPPSSGSPCWPASARSPSRSTRSTGSSGDGRRASTTSPPTARPTSACTSASPRRPAPRALVNAVTEAQGAMTDVISHIAHPPEVLAWSNGQHERLLAAVRRRDATLAAKLVTEHLNGTVHVFLAFCRGAALDFKPIAAIDSRLEER